MRASRVNPTRRFDRVAFSGCCSHQRGEAIAHSLSADAFTSILQAFICAKDLLPMSASITRHYQTPLRGYESWARRTIEKRDRVNIGLI